MEDNISHYFITSVAVRILAGNDQLEEAELYNCLLGEKSGYFRRVAHETSPIPWQTQEQIADEAFNDAFVDVKAQAKLMHTAAMAVVKTERFDSYFYSVFKRKHFKLIQKELRRLELEEIFGTTLPDVIEKKDKEFSQLAITTINQIGKVCQQFIAWYFIEGLSYDEIVAQRRGEISRDTAIKMVSRCKGRFIEKWENLKKQYGKGR